MNTGEPDYLLELGRRQAKSAVKCSAFNKFPVATTFVLDTTVLWRSRVRQNELALGRALCECGADLLC